MFAAVWTPLTWLGFESESVTRSGTVGAVMGLMTFGALFYLVWIGEVPIPGFSPEVDRVLLMTACGLFALAILSEWLFGPLSVPVLVIAAGATTVVVGTVAIAIGMVIDLITAPPDPEDPPLIAFVLGQLIMLVFYSMYLTVLAGLQGGLLATGAWLAKLPRYL